MHAKLADKRRAAKKADQKIARIYKRKEPEHKPESESEDDVQEGDDDDPSCVVCLARPRAVVLLPCRHLSLCALCAAGVSTCPMCRGAVEETMAVFV